jgi:glycosyltransferase involved in cell wall biosynthesis
VTKGTKSILVLVERFGQGGAEKVASMVAQMLHQRGVYSICFCALYEPEEMPGMPGIDVCSLGIRRGAGLVAKVSNYYRAVRALKRLKRERQTDLSISSLWPVDWMNAITGREQKVAVIQINILNNPQNVAMVKARRLVSAIYRKMDKIVLGGSNLLDELHNFFGVPSEKLLVIHNPIDTALISKNVAVALSNELKPLFEGNKVFVAANRLAEIKNTIALVRIWAGMQLDATVKLLIIGEGEEKGALEKAILDAGMRWVNIGQGEFDATADIYFLGFQRNIHNIISRSSAFLFPTKGEGLPLGLIEAMYSGAPVIVSDCPNGGIGEIMCSERPFDPEEPRSVAEASPGGFLMPIPESPETDASWAEKIEALLAADHATLEEMKAWNRQRAAEFDIDTIKQHWYSLAEELTKN